MREEQKISQEEAAERCGLHRTYYSGVERSVRNVSLVNVDKISKGFEVIPIATVLTPVAAVPNNHDLIKTSTELHDLLLGPFVGPSKA